MYREQKLCLQAASSHGKGERAWSRQVIQDKNCMSLRLIRGLTTQLSLHSVLPLSLPQIRQGGEVVLCHRLLSIKERADLSAKSN